MTTHKALTLTALLLVAGCAAPQMSPERRATADYGPPPPAHYGEMIKDRFSKILIDPTSPIYDIDKPRKGYTMPSSLYGTGETFGWVVCGTVNSKNRMGGYSGRTPFFTLFRGDHIVTFIPGETKDRSWMNDDIRRACNR